MKISYQFMAQAYCLSNSIAHRIARKIYISIVFITFFFHVSFPHYFPYLLSVEITIISNRSSSSSTKTIIIIIQYLTGKKCSMPNILQNIHCVKYQHFYKQRYTLTEQNKWCNSAMNTIVFINISKHNWFRL